MVLYSSVNHFSQQESCSTMFNNKGRMPEFLLFPPWMTVSICSQEPPKVSPCYNKLKLIVKALNSPFFFLLFPGTQASQLDRTNYHGYNMHCDYECVCFLKWLTDCSPRSPRHTGFWLVSKIYPKFPCSFLSLIRVTGTTESHQIKYALFLMDENPLSVP